MAEYVQPNSDDECPQWCRQISTASTTLPSSPILSRTASPWNESEVDESANTEKEDLADSTVCNQTCNTSPSKGAVVFLPLLSGMFTCGLLNSMSFRICMGALAILTLLIGLYLSLVDGCSLDDTWPSHFEAEETSYFEYGCSPKGSKEQGNDGQEKEVIRSTESEHEQNISSSTGGVFFLSVLSGVLMPGLLNSMSFQISMGALATLTLLTGLYLYMVDGCTLDHTWPQDFEAEEGVYFEDASRPEDINEHKEHDDSQMEGRAPLLLPVILALVSMCGMFSSMPLYAFVGVFAALMLAFLMLLPGLYVYVVDERRTEDREAEEAEGSNFQKRVKHFMMSQVDMNLVSLYFMVVSTVFCGFIGVASALMLYGISVSEAFRVFMGVVAALVLACLMLLPKLYMLVMDGCCAEDSDEPEDINCMQEYFEE